MHDLTSGVYVPSFSYYSLVPFRLIYKKKLPFVIVISPFVTNLARLVEVIMQFKI